MQMRVLTRTKVFCLYYTRWLKYLQPLHIEYSIIKTTRGGDCLNEKLQKLMTARNVTAYRVSKDTGISETTISNWKAGKTIPDTRTLYIVAKYFGVNMEYFLEAQDDCIRT